MERHFVLCAVFLLFACNMADGLDEFPGLRERVDEYYRYEQNRQWDRAYELRTPAYKKLVSKESYIQTMTKDSIGWELKEFSTLRSNNRSGKVYVEMRFVEHAPKSYVPDIANTKNISEITLNQTSIWMQIDGKWYCYDAASRMHLSANHPTAPE